MNKPGDDTFENLEVWQEAVDLAARVYQLFRECKDWEFRRQVQAASLSISSNIAEGYERDSNAEFVRFLDIARASCGELRSQTYVAVRIGLLPEEVGMGVIAEAKRLSKRIGRLMEVRRTQFS
jgi:four helix bundle protein